MSMTGEEAGQGRTKRTRKTVAVTPQVIGLFAIAALTLTACSPEDPAEGTDGDSTSTSSPHRASSGTTDEATDAQPGRENPADVLVADVDDPVTFEECEQAEDHEEATVTWLDDEVIDEEEHPAEPPKTITLGSEDVEIPGVPGVVVPKRQAQTGCIIEYDAPGNCLPRVEISGAYIPGYTLPQRTLPGVELPDGTDLDEKVIDAVSVDERVVDPVSVDEVCQKDEDDAKDGETIAGVTRAALTRTGVTQTGSTQTGVTRAGTNLDDQGSVPSMSVGYISADYLSLDYVSIDYETLPYYTLEGAEHTEYSEKDATTSYTTEGDVLFASDEHELRADAEPELQTIADDIADRDDDFVIEVEGHTDHLQTTAYEDNQELSKLRAESVVAWLTENAGVDESGISAEGLGAEYPRAANDTDDGRQQNRRVVITVKPEDEEPAIDYELRDG